MGTKTAPKTSLYINFKALFNLLKSTLPIGNVLKKVISLSLLILLVFLINVGYFDEIKLFAWPHYILYAVFFLFLVFKASHQLQKALTHATSRHYGYEEIEFYFYIILINYLLLIILRKYVDLYSLIYITLAFIFSFSPVRVAWSCLIFALFMENSLFFSHLYTPEKYPLFKFLEHAGFIILFSLMPLLFLKGEVFRLRLRSSRTLKKEFQRIKSEALDFRLITSGLTDQQAVNRDQVDTKLNQIAIENIHKGVNYILKLLKSTLECHSCILFWLDTRGESLLIKEIVTDSRCIKENPLSIKEGLLGTTVKQQGPVRLKNLKDHFKGLNYYTAFEPVFAFISVPIRKDGIFKGILCADRLIKTPFTEEDEKKLYEATNLILSTITSEQQFKIIERAKFEQERFFQASKLLNKALELEEVLKVSLEAVHNIIQYDFGAITLYQEAEAKHSIESVYPATFKNLLAKSFKDNLGMVSMVLKNKHYLPYGFTFDPKSSFLFDKELLVDGLKSLLVLPLIHKDFSLGTLVIGSLREGFFSNSLLGILEVIANQAAVSIDNAKMYSKVTRMATMDGLTGLYNHRVFQEKFDEMLARAKRHQKSLTLILADIDHFKAINDTYGHQTGDAVLKGISNVLLSSIRITDVAARYGGEEFAILLEETDRSGGKTMAERIRLNTEKQPFNYLVEKFSVTISLGIATYPTDLKSIEPSDRETKKAIVEMADKALYYAKNNGRNQSFPFYQFKKQNPG